MFSGELVHPSCIIIVLLVALAILLLVSTTCLHNRRIQYMSKAFYVAITNDITITYNDNYPRQ
jgi:hypothetical protein